MHPETTPAHTVHIGSLKISNTLPFVLLAGPCVLESEAHALKMAGALVDITNTLGVPFIFKTSFDKANRTAGKSQRGVGLKEALPIFRKIKETYGCPIVTDVHEPHQCAPVAEVVDMLQTPALLCRQTDLIQAAAQTGKPVNIKKGQFLSPGSMRYAVEKAFATGNKDILVCERGTMFGYSDLINDMRGLVVMRQTGCPVVFDATHSVQQPPSGETTKGNRTYAPILARAALSIGVASIFAEVHDDPDNAPSDGANMLILDQFSDILKDWQRFDRMAKEHPITL